MTGTWGRAVGPAWSSSTIDVHQPRGECPGHLPCCTPGVASQAPWTVRGVDSGGVALSACGGQQGLAGDPGSSPGWEGDWRGSSCHMGLGWLCDASGGAESWCWMS